MPSHWLEKTSAEIETVLTREFGEVLQLADKLAKGITGHSLQLGCSECKADVARLRASLEKVMRGGVNGDQEN